MHAVRVFATTVACLVVVGCGGQDTPPHETAYPVSGLVTVKGNPAFEARLTATLVGGSDPVRQYEALSDEKGEFRFGTNTDSDGLPPGRYDIRVTWPEIVRRSDPSREVDRLNGRYNSAQKAAFTIEVKDGNNTLPPFNLR